MNGDTPITVEYVFGLAVSFLIALLWYWVKSISDGLKEARAERDRMRAMVHQVKLDYATKSEARDNHRHVMNALERLENKFDRLAEKLERKADK
ncbi:hypothetical protein [Neisseria leonii]|uniref:hypothetical protein n=1 Tax=Neisseria leonii TaxID=2995413 RepID=UPI00237A4336|nr:hypothetical protein [Neisseria sp. 3986]MDD9325627.1 hypothetical protein [Neisseria sp. 3986]